MFAERRTPVRTRDPRMPSVEKHTGTPLPPAGSDPAFKPFYGTSLVTPGGPDEHAAARWNWLSPHLPPLTGQRVLDVGCAEGLLTRKMAQAGAAFVVGIEKRADRVEWANQMPEVAEGRLRFYHGKAHDLRELAARHPEHFGGGFSLVTCIGVLQHIPHREKAAALRGLCSQARDLLLVEAPFAENVWHFLKRRRPTFRMVQRAIEPEGFTLVKRSGNITLWRRTG